jgi:CO/xanthine dehydrogenase Mo-binding subunit
MTTRYFGAPIKRNEDPRLLRGRALFVDDVALPNMMHVAFLRSAVAHGRIRRIDAAAARRRAGVVAVYTEVAGHFWRKSLIENRNGLQTRYLYPSKCHFLA